MIILTAANADLAKDDFGNVYPNFSYRGVIQKTAEKAEQCGYKPIIYDLGTLGIGKPFYVANDSFSTKGYYETEVQKGYKSKSLFKPEMVRHCLEEFNDFTVYLDGDAQLVDNIDEVLPHKSYDIGVTLRDPYEFESEWYKEHFDIVKYVNAGVIFFNPTSATKKFIDIWHKTTEEVGNDQMALNKLTSPGYYPEIGSTLEVNGVKIKYFPGTCYNYYYFKRKLCGNIKIMHFKGSVRNFYPFDWKKRLYCNMVAIIYLKLSPVATRQFFR